MKFQANINDWILDRKKEWNSLVSRMWVHRLVKIARDKSPNSWRSIGRLRKKSNKEASEDETGDSLYKELRRTRLSWLSMLLDGQFKKFNLKHLFLIPELERAEYISLGHDWVTPPLSLGVAISLDCRKR